MDNQEYLTIRGVQIPKKQIESVEQKYNAKIVKDGEWALLHELDKTLFAYRKQYGHDPDMVKLLSHPGELFKFMTFNISLYGMEFPGAYNKPAWFRFKHVFTLQPKSIN